NGRGGLGGEGDRAVSMGFGVSASPPRLVGRQAELARLNAAWQRARQDGAHVVGGAGAAGSGEATLLRGLVARDVDGPVVWTGGGWEEEYAQSQPWSVLRQLVRALPGSQRSQRSGHSDGDGGDPLRIPGPDLAPVFAAQLLVGELRRHAGVVVVI